MAVDVPRVYVDADVFIHVLADQDHAEESLGVLEAAERGDIRVVANRLLSVEVGGWGGTKPGQTEADEMVATYLDGVGVEWVELDIMIARDARTLGWQYKLRSADAVHLATAVRRKADYFMSYDEAFPFGEKVNGVAVMKPAVIWQPTLI